MSFQTDYMRKAIPGVDYDPDEPMCQDDYEYFSESEIQTPGDIVVKCECDEQCSRGIALRVHNNALEMHTYDGKLLDRVVLPDWLADAIRSAVKAQETYGGEE